jgi:gamma-glutamylcyclotransferase (GGCT)/AIG2-like uncharacterized protein YtfP
MTLHFAYGSNMHVALMARRCPGADAVGTARLDNWRYLITRDGYASVAPAPGSRVYGILWRLGPRELAALNAYESLDSGLYVRRWLSVCAEDRQRRALVYVGRSRVPGRPVPGYQNKVVLSAARSWEFPAGYLAELTRWAQPGSFGPAAPSPGARR